MFAEYNRWMNEKLYAAAAQLTDEQRKADLGAFFKSIHATFEHLLGGDRRWLQRFRGEPVTADFPGGPRYSDFEELRAERARFDAEIIAWSQGVTNDWLAKPFIWTTVTGLSFTHPGFAVVAQFFNHQTHHRGQITTLLTQLGVDVGVTDIPLLPLLNEPA